MQRHDHRGQGHDDRSLNRSAFQATTHCLTGCAIGEVLGMVIATAAGWGNASSIAISVVLAFVFGYSLTLGPVLRAMCRCGAQSVSRSPPTRSRS
jgi:hypothetical protein